MVSQEIVEQSRNVFGLTNKVMFLWSAGASTGFIAKTINDELVDAAAAAGQDAPEEGQWGYWKVYYQLLISSHHILTRKGISRYDIAVRTEDYWEFKRKPKNRAITTMEGFKTSLVRSGKTTATSITIRNLDLRGVNFHELLKEAGCVQNTGGQDGQELLDVTFIHNMEFKDCNLEGVDLHDIDLACVHFNRCNLKGANLHYSLDRNINNSRYNWRSLSFKMCDMRNSTLSGRQISTTYDTLFQGAVLDGAAVGSFNYALEYRDDERTGFSPANVAKGDFIHIERLNRGQHSGWATMRGIYASVKLACGISPIELAPHLFKNWTLLPADDAKGLPERCEYVYKILTRKEWNRVLQDPILLNAKDTWQGSQTFDSLVFSRAIKIVFDIDLDGRRNFSDQLHSHEINRTFILWIKRHYEELSRPGNPEHPRPFIGTDPMINHLELVRIVDLGVAGEKANPEEVFQRVLARAEEHRIAREEQQRIWDLGAEEREARNLEWQLGEEARTESIKGVTYPVPSEKVVPVIPEYLGIAIRQLIRYDEFTEEGKVMNHCVGLYAGAAAVGEQFIYHVGPEGGDGATLSLNKDGSIQQLRGVKNAAVPEMRKLVNQWLCSGKKVSKAKKAHERTARLARARQVQQ